MPNARRLFISPNPALYRSTLGATKALSSHWCGEGRAEGEGRGEGEAEGEGEK